MKKNTSNCSAFFTLRVVIALLLCSVGVMFAFEAASQFGDKNLNASRTPGWLARFTASLGVPSLPKNVAEQRTADSGGAAPIHISPAEPRPPGPGSQAPVVYHGPQQDFRPVQAVESGELRHARPIHPSKARKPDHPKPIRPPPPTENGGVEGPLQTTMGPQWS